jgi:tetratricopeptide (TPR) repeat protein
MPAFENLFLVILLVLLAGTALVLVLGLMRGRGGEARQLYAAAVAARHQLDFARADELVAELLAADPRDGEAWIERGLAAAYRGDLARAEADLARALALRADLAEPITLHRAWVRVLGGRTAEALRLFEEVEAPLLSKFTTDLGTDDPLVAEWLLHAAALWQAAGDRERAAWARDEARRAAPESRLAEVAGGTQLTGTAGSSSPSGGSPG